MKNLLIFLCFLRSVLLLSALAAALDAFGGTWA
jgi:hypothetical protein